MNDNQVTLLIYSILEKYYQDNPPSNDASTYNLDVAKKIVDGMKSKSIETPENTLKVK